MLKLLNRFFFFSFFLSIFLISAKSVLAQNEFSTDYQVDYLINEKGITHTKFNITLKNNLSNIYAKEFALSIGSTKLENIKAYNQDGDLKPKIITGNKTTNITIPFSDKILGKDKSNQFTLEFDSLDFASKLGQVWEISIPKLQKTDSLNIYQLNLVIPKSFGQPATFSPTPASSTSQGSHLLYQFSTADLLESGISATFGELQHFNFSLNYHLQNQNVYKITTEIALPPDTSYQKIIYQTLNPPPTNVEVDKDGNWLATYALSPKETIDVLATGSAQIFLNPRTDFETSSLDDLDSYLNPQQYWETNNPKIQALASELKTPYQIYQYVVDNLIYDYGRLSESTTRFGAANTLDNQDSAICMEFTDLFVALTRAAGIPSRAVNGYAYTTNSALRPLSLKKDVLHAWPEYFNSQKNIWVPVDPTWGNTTGGVDFFHQKDLNHFSFVNLGQESTYPVPAGAYKVNGNQSKDVKVDFGIPQTPIESSVLKIDLPKTLIAGVDLTGKIILTNNGNTALYNQTISLQSEKIKFNQSQWLIPILPPYSQKEVEFIIPASGWLDNYQENLMVTSNLSSASHQLSVLPAYYYLLSLKKVLLSFGAVFGALLGFGIYKLIAKKKKSS